MGLLHQPSGITPDSGRSKRRIFAPRRCPSCGVLAQSHHTVCTSCKARLYCPKKVSDLKIMTLGVLLSLLCFILVVSFMFILDRMT